MKLDKIKNTFNDYKLEVSWGQLEAMRGALEASHADPMTDELLAELDWYMQRVPGPGEEEGDQKAREEGAAAGKEDFPIPMPPGEETVAAEPGAEVGAEGAGEPDLPPGAEEVSPEEAMGGAPAEGGEEGGPALPEEPEEGAPEVEMERRVPKPPKE